MTKIALQQNFSVDGLWQILVKLLFIFLFVCFYFFFIIVGFVIHWNESAMDLHVFPIPIPPPTSLSTQSL